MDAPKDYKDFIVSVKERIRNAQYEALKAVNKELVGLYWDIGKMIYDKQKELGWGKTVVDNISDDLKKEFPASRGFSVSNLWYMVQFYTEYKDDVILQPLVGEIGWVHNLIIFSKCHSQGEREFYLRSSKKFGWSKRVLEREIENETYNKFQLGQANFNDLPSLVSKRFFIKPL